MPTKKNPNLPTLMSKASGKLIVTGGIGSAQLALYENKTNRTFLLNDGDTILLDNKLIATVAPEYTGNDRLNGYLGYFIKGSDHPEFAQTQQLFLFSIPTSGDDLSTLIDAYFNETELTVKFLTKPVAEPDSRFISGNLMAYYETGMERIAFSMHDRNRSGYDGLNILEAGDFITVFNAKGTRVIWQGQVTEKRLKHWFNCYYKHSKPTKLIDALLQAFIYQNPVLLNKAKKPKTS